MNISQSLVDAETLTNPFPYYARIRAEAPVYYDERAQAWLVTRYDDVQQSARMTAELSNELGFQEAARSQWQAEIDAMMLREGFGPHIISDNFQVDPPKHARRRGLVDQAFSGPRVAEMESHIRAIGRELMDKFIDRGRADLVSEFSRPFSIYVISDLLNVPRDRVDDVSRWSDAAIAPLSGGLNKEQMFAYARDLMDMHRYLAEQIQARRENRGSDMISDLVHARIDDPDNPQLSFAELLSICVALLAAGNETTRNGISFGGWILAQHPEVFDALRNAENQNQALQRFVEEILRLQPPVPQLPRFATRDCQIGGVTIPKGSYVLLCFASANRDENRFEGGDQFILGRKNAGQHLTFGIGVHRCLGAMLARMEMKCAFREIVNRMDSFRLTIPDQDVSVWGALFFRGPRNLPVSFMKRSGEDRARSNLANPI